MSVLRSARSFVADFGAACLEGRDTLIHAVAGLFAARLWDADEQIVNELFDEVNRQWDKRPDPVDMFFGPGGTHEACDVCKHSLIFHDAQGCHHDRCPCEVFESSAVAQPGSQPRAAENPAREGSAQDAPAGTLTVLTPKEHDALVDELAAVMYDRVYAVSQYQWPWFQTVARDLVKAGWRKASQSNNQK